MHISNRHNEKEQTTLRKNLRNNATAAESLLWLRLKGKQVEGLKFRRQYGVGPYILDFYCASAKIAIELDGSQHYEEKGKAKDEERDTYLNERGITVLRYSNRDVNQQFRTICEDIENHLIRQLR